MMTAGSGDVVHKSTAGHFTALILIVAGALYLAIPTGIVSNAFDRVLEDRGKLLLMKKTCDQVVQRGYEASDISRLFDLNEQTDTGELNYCDLRRMSNEMRVGMSEGQKLVLFQSFDYGERGPIGHMFLFLFLLLGLFLAAYGRLSSV